MLIITMDDDLFSDVTHGHSIRRVDLTRPTAALRQVENVRHLLLPAACGHGSRRLMLAPLAAPTNEAATTPPPA